MTDPLAANDGIAQLPLGLPSPPDQRFDAFLHAPPGTIQTLQHFATEPGRPWLYLQGAHGTGKTHLLIAACVHARDAGRTAAYLPMATARGRMRDALNALHHADMLALDDVDAIAGERDDEVALFDLHNRARERGVAVVYAAARAPAELGLCLPDLTSRLGQCTRIALHALDDAQRADVLRDRARRRGLQLEDAAIDWLLKRVGRDLGGLTALLNQLDRASLAAQRRLTIPFLREVLQTS